MAKDKRKTQSAPLVEATAASQPLRSMVIGLRTERQLELLARDLGIFDAEDLSRSELVAEFEQSEEFSDEVLLGLLPATVLVKIAKTVGIPRSGERDTLEQLILEAFDGSASHQEHQVSGEPGGGVVDHLTPENPGGEESSSSDGSVFGGITVSAGLMGCKRFRLFLRNTDWLLTSRRGAVFGSFQSKEHAVDWLELFDAARGIRHIELKTTQGRRSKRKQRDAEYRKLVREAKKRVRRRGKTSPAALSDSVRDDSRSRSFSTDIFDRRRVVSGGGANGTGKRR